MPSVVFTCTCKTAFERWKRDGEAWTHDCPKCGQTVTDALGPINLSWAKSIHAVGDQYDYVSPVSGEHISSKRAHREHLKKHGLIELGNEKPKLERFKPSIPREQIREEIRNNVERMKSHGSWRER